ncbi:inositol monophosphatase family protein [Rubinisphaera margarita]|uniref:inositol monophosphatase family protein n=1 Tax=Rubinisphaera margarita TaxID=2909586 RepID=UPI001EE87ABF|nr:inositol monophosphatase family protein [Rubinisphaera margarita]MCG6157182.1 inositol monophosphatase [Rubinisphaera margarita]
MADTERWQPMVERASLAARKAGEILQDWRERFTVSEKSRSNLVTEADFAAEKAIHETLSEAFPDHGYLGEEGLSENASTADYVWIIDPLDGTGNYVHGFPYYCVSIGLQYQGRMVVGVIYDPTRDELFTAAEGCGAWKNGKRLQVSGTTQLSQAMCVASLPVAGDPNHPALARFIRALPHAQTIQRLGSAEMNLAYLAAGHLDAFWSSTLKPWDMAAGIVLVQEAGGTLSNLTGGPIDIHACEILACSSSTLQTELVPILKQD